MRNPFTDPPMFEADWKCFCGSIIGLKVALAYVQSDAGIQVSCKNCKQLFAVRPDGAHALDKPNGKATDAADQPYTGPIDADRMNP